MAARPRRRATTSVQCGIGATNRAPEARVDGLIADFVNRSIDPAF
jgi:hypothetical protein